MKKYFLVGVFISTFSSAIFGENSDILAVNNQALFDFQYIHQNANNFNYAANQNFILVPPSNLYGNLWGFDLSARKTFSPIYTQVDLNFNDNHLLYTPNSTLFSQTPYFLMQGQGRVGYRFDVSNTTATTPFILFGYQYWQFDKGGWINNQGLQFNGYTQFFQDELVGLGVLEQWAASHRFVLNGEAIYGAMVHPWTRFNAPDTLGGVAAVVYQQANLSSAPFYELGLSGDYRATNRLHMEAGISYEHYILGSGTPESYVGVTLSDVAINNWVYHAGLAYHFDEARLPQDNASNNAISRTEDLIAANNQMKLLFGYMWQRYGELQSTGSGYLDRQSGSLPEGMAILDKTFRHIYTELSLMEGIGNTDYIGQTLSGNPLNTNTRNTLMDVAGRLGYRIDAANVLAFTPYFSAGYHRWMRDTAGIDTSGYLLNGYPETYQQYWVGAGLLFQWAPIKRWVLGLDGLYATTLDPQNSSWNTFTDPVTIRQSLELQTKPFYEVGLSSDYAFKKYWHFIMSVDYLSFSYGASPPSSLGVLEPSSNTHQTTLRLGIGYAFS